MENDIIPLNALSADKRTLLNRSTNTPKFYITLFDYEITETFIKYMLEIGRQSIFDDKQIYVHHVQTRYSQLLRLYNDITNNQSFTSFNFTEFPPKKWFNNLTTETANERLSQINMFLHSLNKLPYATIINSFNVVFGEHVGTS